MKKISTVVLFSVIWFLGVGGSSAVMAASVSSEFSDFDSFVKTYTKTIKSQQNELMQSFITWQKKQGGFPIVEEDGGVVFFYKGTGSEKEVSVVGDFRTRNFYSTGWDQTGEKMRPLADGSAVFFVKMSFEKDARLDYKFMVDGKSVRDPLNSNDIVSGPGGDASELIMPDYTVPKEFISRSDVSKGSLHVIDANWAQPQVTVYLPAGYNPDASYPVIYTADGSAWLKFMSLPTILDNLIADNEIEPVIAVMVDAEKDRRHWHYYNPDYLKYIEKVVKYIDVNYSTKSSAEHRLHIGTSSGGSIAFYTGFERPDLFLNIAMLSPSLTGLPHYYEPYFSGDKQPNKNLNIWMSAGKYEGYIDADTKTMKKYFDSVGLKSKATFTKEGHSFGAWRNISIKMFKYFF